MSTSYTAGPPDATAPARRRPPLRKPNLIGLIAALLYTGMGCYLLAGGHEPVVAGLVYLALGGIHLAEGYRH